MGTKNVKLKCIHINKYLIIDLFIKVLFYACMTKQLEDLKLDRKV